MKSSLSSPSWSNPFFALLFAAGIVSIDEVVALQSPLLLIRVTSSSTFTGTAPVSSSSNNNNGIICTGINRRINCNHRGITNMATSSSSSEGEKANVNRKGKAKSKSGRKTKSKTKTKSVDNNDDIIEITASDIVPPDSSSNTFTITADNNKNNGDIYYGPQVTVPDIFKFDITGGRPGTIIESEYELERKKEIMEEIKVDDAKKTGRKKYSKWLETDYGFLEEDEDAEYDTDDPGAIDAATLGQYDISDLNTKFDYEWDPDTDPDPNLIETQSKDEIISSGKYILETEKDEEGIEVGYNPMFGPSNPIDERTRIGTIDSYMIDVNTRDEKMLTPEFFPDDPEVAYNEDIVQYRRSMDIIETYQDEFLPQSMPVPRNVAKWYGYPEPMGFESKNYTNNRFTELENLTNFDELPVFRARQKAIELARSNNAEWMADGVSQAWHQQQRQPYEVQETLVGTLRKGECDPDTVEMMKPALSVLGSIAQLLSIEGEHGTVFRFHYYGLIKDKFGMSCWTETLIRDCGIDVTGVIFETGFRARDPAYDGGFPYHGWE